MSILQILGKFRVRVPVLVSKILMSASQQALVLCWHSLQLLVPVPAASLLAPLSTLVLPSEGDEPQSYGNARSFHRNLFHTLTKKMVKNIIDAYGKH